MSRVGRWRRAARPNPRDASTRRSVDGLARHRGRAACSRARCARIRLACREDVHDGSRRPDCGASAAHRDVGRRRRAGRVGTATMMPVLSAELARVSYGDRAVLRDVQLEIYPKEIVGLTGPVGSGKTTLALACAGLLGHAVPARIDGRIHHATLAPPVAGFVFDDPLAQFTGLGGTVEEEVAVGPENLAIPRDAIRGRVDRALAAADATHLARRLPDELSGGERQRVALACALALEAPLLVLDEPTAQLDPDATQRFGERLRALAAQGTSVLLVSQDADLLRTLATRVLVLDDGATRAFGRPSDVLDEIPDHERNDEPAML